LQRELKMEHLETVHCQQTYEFRIISKYPGV
jgi:hypothetical protein